MPAKKGKSTSFGTVYPSDVWFYIARYIPPEDLSRFALICKDAYRVMLSVQYWKELCKRYFTLTFSNKATDYILLIRYKGDETTLPRELQSPCDSRRGLRARAIRLMFLRCPALIKSIKPPVAARYEPYTLHGMRLLLAWHEVRYARYTCVYYTIFIFPCSFQYFFYFVQKEGSNWNFYFKWISRHINEHNHQRGELFENPEAGCRVLKATCNEFICFPYPQYCYLSSIHLGLTSDMRHQKLSLGFNDYTTTHCTARMKQTLGRGSVVQNRIDLEPIAKCILMDWWHPEYPYPREHSRPSVLPCPTEEW